MGGKIALGYYTEICNVTFHGCIWPLHSKIKLILHESQQYDFCYSLELAFWVIHCYLLLKNPCFSNTLKVCNITLRLTVYGKVYSLLPLKYWNGWNPNFWSNVAFIIINNMGAVLDTLWELVNNLLFLHLFLICLYKPIFYKRAWNYSKS